MPLEREEMEAIAMSLNCDVYEEEEPEPAVAMESTLAEAPANASAADDGNLVTRLQDMLGCDAETCQHLLEASGWDLQTAMSLFMDGNAPSPKVSVTLIIPNSIPLHIRSFAVAGAIVKDRQQKWRDR
jgi:hypothetical protein